MRQVFNASVRVALAALAVTAAQSVYWSPGASVPFSTLVTCLAIVAAWRPAWGLLALAMLAPFGRMIAVVWLDGFPIRGAEALTLAFLAGAAVRFALRPPAGRVLPTRVTGPWILFAACVVASAVVLYRVAQFYLDYPGVFFIRLLTYLATDYQGIPGDPRPWSQLTTFGSVEAAALVVEGIALLFVAGRLVATTPGLAVRLAATLVTGGVVAALMSIDAFVSIAVSTATSLGSVADLLADERVAVHVTKVNTAGSYFVMIATLAAGMALRRSRGRLLWTVAFAALLVGLWLTASLAAVLAGMTVAIVAGALWLRRAQDAGRRWRRVTVAIVATVFVAGLVRVTTRPDATESLLRRVTITKVSLDTMAEAPVFGVGIGDYPLRSQPYVTDEIREGFGTGSIAPHNYLLHIAAELGVVGIAVFLWAIVATLRQARGAFSSASPAGPAAAAFVAFLLSALAGQPMLVDAVAIPVWLTLAILLSNAPAPAGPEDRAGQPWWVVAGIVAITATLPLRLAAAVREQNFPFAGRGTTLIEHPDHEITTLVHRLDGPARLFVSGSAPAIALRAGADPAEETETLFLNVRADGVMSPPLILPHGGQRTVCLAVEPGSAQTGPRALDIDVVDAAGRSVSARVWVRVDGLREPCGRPSADPAK